MSDGGTREEHRQERRDQQLNILLKNHVSSHSEMSWLTCVMLMMSVDFAKAPWDIFETEKNLVA